MTPFLAHVRHEGSPVVRYADDTLSALEHHLCIRCDGVCVGGVLRMGMPCVWMSERCTGVSVACASSRHYLVDKSHLCWN